MKENSFILGIKAKKCWENIIHPEVRKKIILPDVSFIQLDMKQFYFAGEKKIVF